MQSVHASFLRNSLPTGNAASKCTYLPIPCSGETICKASKSIAEDLEDIYGNNIPLNRGFDRRIDLLLSTRNIELSTNE